MSSMSRKFLKNKNIDIKMSIKFKCPTCGDEKLISQNTIQKLDPNTFRDNEIFKCKKCSIRMNPMTVEVDY
ncbi:MAG: hypothetical protein RR923_07185 [Bacilli bacterium]